MHRVLTTSSDLKERNKKKYAIYVLFCRVWGLITSIVLLGIGVDEIFQTLYLGIYLLCVGFIVAFIELSFLIDAFIDLYVTIRRGIACKLWNVILWVDYWRRGVLYLLLSAACFINPLEDWLAVIAGSALVVSSILYIVKSHIKRHLDFPMSHTAVEQTSGSAEDEESDVPEEFNVRLEDFDDSLPAQLENVVLDVDGEENVPIMSDTGNGEAGAGGGHNILEQQHIINA